VGPAPQPRARQPRHPGQALSFKIGAPVKDDITRAVVVRERHEEGEGLVRLVLADPRGRPLPAWSAGSHVDLVAGGFRRKYSLCGTRDDRSVLEVVILREAEGRGGSRHFCDAVAAGDTIHLAGPKNLFRLDESAQHHVLIAGGIGITPILAMADRLKALGKPYALHYAARSRAHMALLARVQRDHGASLSLHVSEEGSRMQLEALLANMGEGTQVYCCGPERLIDALQALGEGWPEGTLHVEHFSAEGSLLDPAKEHAFEAVLKDSGTTVTVAADQTLLQALQAAGIDVPCDCGEGPVRHLRGRRARRRRGPPRQGAEQGGARRQHPHDELLLPRARADESPWRSEPETVTRSSPSCPPARRPSRRVAPRAAPRPRARG
jgi:ferredoxin-NADP reductase